MWITEFQIALVQEDVDKLSSLIESMPAFESLEEMKTAQYLLKQAKELMLALQNNTRTQLKQLKKSISFMDAAARETGSKIDLKQ